MSRSDRDKLLLGLFARGFRMAEVQFGGQFLTLHAPEKALMKKNFYVGLEADFRYGELWSTSTPLSNRLRHKIMDEGAALL